MKMREMGLRRVCAFSVLLASLAGLLGWRADYFPEKSEKSGTFPRRKIAEVKPGNRTMSKHTGEFKFTAEHGAEFLKDKANCQVCHGQDLRGGSFQVGCTKCHPVLSAFDHFSGDVETSHGAAYLQIPGACSGCHGADYRGKNRATACFDCHEFPHKSGTWTRPSEHGKAYVESKSACNDCHLKKRKGKLGTHFISCDQCHPMIPHPGEAGEWADNAEHASAGGTYEGQCKRCHTDFQRLVEGYGGCGDCHSAEIENGFDILMKWKRPAAASVQTTRMGVK